MPELPEVETIVRELAPHVKGQHVTSVRIIPPYSNTNPPPQELAKLLTGRSIAALLRRGKYLIFKLMGGGALVVHLRMSGALLLKKAGAEVNNYTRAVITLENGSEIHFRDVRRLGTMCLAEDATVNGLGPEPLGEGFNPQGLALMLKNRRAPIKALLLDQRTLAGLGNMYADEALFQASIHPLRAGGSLTDEEVKRLYRAIQEVLQRGIVCGGASVDTYIRPGGGRGTAQDCFRVAHKRGSPCPTCGTALEWVKVRGRGSCFCPRCQPTE